MLLSAAGDAIGYYNGKWEFNYNGADIHDQALAMGGVEKIVVNPHKWMVSDDTVMHVATAKALLKVGEKKMSDAMWKALCDEYVECWPLMPGRGPGPTCARAIGTLQKYGQVSYNGGGGGCGAAMRTMCIGLVLYKEDQLKDLIAISTEAGRCTHNHPTGFLGGVVSALFTSYAIRGVPLLTWGHKFLTEAYPLCLEYMKESKPELWTAYDNSSLSYFADKWTYLLNERDLNRPDATAAVFPEGFKTEIKQREAFYAAKTFAFAGWAGSSGHDAVMLAYDALVGCEGDWNKFLYWGALHGGDSDSTGAIGAAWFGVLYGFQGVPKGHYEDIEFKDELQTLATKLHKMATD
jgi:ADP-ribosylarginine hydrolase